MKRTAATALLFCLFISSVTHAFEENQFRLGVKAGNVGLQGDLSSAGNAIGSGVILGYGATPDFVFTLGYLASSHTGLKHSETSVGVDYYFNSYDAVYFNAAFGADFIGHELTNASISSSGFGIYGGLGMDLELGKSAAAGLQAIYHNAFETSVVVAGQNVKAIQPYTTVLVRFLFFL